MGPALQSPPSPPPEASPTRLQRARATWDRVPGQVRLLTGFLVLFAVAFSATVLPLITSTGGKVRAEVAGSVPSSAVAGQQAFLDLAIDNTSGSIIHPLCLAISFDTPVTVRQVVFQGLDSVPFGDGRACGGDLSGQETVSLRVVLVPHQAGTLHLRLVPAEGAQEIGPAVERSVSVAAR